jgi:hypothetical protein
VRTLLILVALAVIIIGVSGCSTAGWSVGRNLNYMADDTTRALGLDGPSALHTRDNIDPYTAEPYHPFD